MRFTAEQNRIWETLFERQTPKIEEYACEAYRRGFDILRLPSARIPSLRFLNSIITPMTGWKTVRTHVRYSDAVPWYKAFAKKLFLVTTYIRDWDELEFTPEPDMFHDIYGHLPFMVLPEYTELQEMFAPAFHRADAEQRENIKRLAWFSTEFGIIRENGELKIFGAGLISSSGEMENVMAGEIPLLPFSIDNVLSCDKSVWSFNETLFVFGSLAGLKQELVRYFDTI